MAEPRQPRATEEDTHMADLPHYPGIPRWVKVFGIIVIVLVLLFVITHFTGVGGMHGPGMHGPGHHMGVGGEHGPRRHMVSTALVTTYRPGTLVATQRPVVLPDEFCLDAAAAGQPAELGAMGFHATNEPISTPACRVRPEARLGMGPAGEGLR